MDDVRDSRCKSAYHEPSFLVGEGRHCSPRPRRGSLMDCRCWRHLDPLREATTMAKLLWPGRRKEHRRIGRKQQADGVLVQWWEELFLTSVSCPCRRQDGHVFRRTEWIPRGRPCDGLSL